MNLLIRHKFLLFYLVIIIYNEITAQSRLEFLSGNDTNILFALNERLILNADLRLVTIDGSGATSKFIRGLTFLKDIY